MHGRCSGDALAVKAGHTLRSLSCSPSHLSSSARALSRLLVTRRRSYYSSIASTDVMLSYIMAVATATANIEADYHRTIIYWEMNSPEAIKRYAWNVGEVRDSLNLPPFPPMAAMHPYYDSLSYARVASSPSAYACQSMLDSLQT